MNVFANIARSLIKGALTAYTKTTQKDLNKSKEYAPNPEKQKDKYQLIFFDDFDTFDNNVWIADNGKRHGGYWSDSQIIVEDSKLKIRTQYLSNGKFGSGYYTGCVATRAVQEPFGYYEVKFKAPKAKGFWSAFWLMQDGFGGSAREGAEIDIIELPSLNMEHRIHSNNYKTRRGASINTSKNYDEWHTASMEWTSSYINFFIDGRLSWKTTDPNQISQVGAGSMLLSCEINGKDCVPECVIGWPIVGLMKENRGDGVYDFEIDYVKVYKIKQ